MRYKRIKDASSFHLSSFLATLSPNSICLHQISRPLRAFQVHHSAVACGQWSYQASLPGGDRYVKYSFRSRSNQPISLISQLIIPLELGSTALTWCSCIGIDFGWPRENLESFLRYNLIAAVWATSKLLARPAMTQHVLRNVKFDSPSHGIAVTWTEILIFSKWPLRCWTK